MKVVITVLLFISHFCFGLELDQRRNNSQFILSTTTNKAQEIVNRFYFLFDEWEEGKITHTLKASWLETYTLWQKSSGECTLTSPCQELDQSLIRFMADLKKLEGMFKDPWQLKIVSQLQIDTKSISQDLHLKMAMSFGKLNQTLWKETLEQIDEQIGSLLLQAVPATYRRHFRVGYILFARKLEKHLIRQKSWNFLYPELQDLNLSWNEFNVSLTKRSLRLSPITLGRLDDINNHWTSLLKDLLKL